MALSYPEQMRLTETFLNEMRLRLSDKTSSMLPPEGKHYDGIEPSRLSLVGCLGPRPDPLYAGPQPPNSIGIVLLVTPNAEGRVECSLSGQFDVVHRYIPDIKAMQRDLVTDGGIPRSGQIISMAFQRYSLPFSGVTLSLDTRRCQEWVTGKAQLAAMMQAEGLRLLEDPRVMRRCVTNPNGSYRTSPPVKVDGRMASDP